MNASSVWIFVSILIIMVIDINCEQKIRRNRTALRRAASCPLPNFKNGVYTKLRDTWTFNCIYGFKLIGPQRIFCRNGRFEHAIPICGKPGCGEIKNRTNGIIQLQKDKIVAKLSCQFGYDLAGSETAYCDGHQWDRELGECRPTIGLTKSCDFETVDLCGWTQDYQENDFPWVRRNGWNALGKLKFGPKHDHTTGKPLHGYYMVAQSINANSEQKARFWSPIHAQSDSENACFRFYYHMYGAYVGQLRVLIKPIDKDIDEVSADSNYLYWEHHESLNGWLESTFMIQKMNSDFQIIFEAIVPKGRISDIAIDDVALLKGIDCGIPEVTESATEEADGIFDIQSCANRCSETESQFMNAIYEYINNGTYTEKCDCDPGCSGLGTCCPDYQLQCTESQDSATDWIDTTTEAIANVPLYPKPLPIPVKTDRKSSDFPPPPPPPPPPPFLPLKPINPPQPLPPKPSPSLFPRPTSKPSQNINTVTKPPTEPTFKISKATQLITNKKNNLEKAIESAPSELRFNQSTASTSKSIWITAICVVSLAIVCISIGLWKHRQKNNTDQRASQIMYISNRQRENLQVDINARDPLISQNAVYEDTVSIVNQNDRPHISDNMKNKLRQTKQFFNRITKK